MGIVFTIIVLIFAAVVGVVSFRSQPTIPQTTDKEQSNNTVRKDEQEQYKKQENSYSDRKYYSSWADIHSREYAKGISINIPDRPPKTLSEKLIDEFDETVKKVLNVIDKDFFEGITLEYTFQPIATALALSIFNTTIGCKLSMMGKSDEKIDGVLTGFWNFVGEYIQEQFSYLSRNKCIVFDSCYTAFCKIQGGLIEPRCLWIAPHEFKGLFALVAAFGDMLSSPDIAKDYENGKRSDKIDFSLPSDKTVQFNEKVLDAGRPVFEGADAIMKILKAHEEEI